jgi:hypothetical protein
MAMCFDHSVRKVHMFTYCSGIWPPSSWGPMVPKRPHRFSGWLWVRNWRTIRSWRRAGRSCHLETRVRRQILGIRNPKHCRKLRCRVPHRRGAKVGANFHSRDHSKHGYPPLLHHQVREEIYMTLNPICANSDSLEYSGCHKAPARTLFHPSLHRTIRADVGTFRAFIGSNNDTLIQRTGKYTTTAGPF